MSISNIFWQCENPVLKQFIIIEKDTETVKRIKAMTDGFEGFSFCGSAHNQNEGLTSLFMNNPDIVFLDMDGTITDLSAFLLDINQHAKTLPVFVGLSSFKKNAYTAFRFDFFDFLLKPLSDLTIRKGLLKYQKKYPLRICKLECHRFCTCETICLKSNKDYQYLHTNEILFLKADNNTTDFYMKDRSIVAAYKTLKTFENKLPDNFLRIHKSYIINSLFVSRIHYGKSVCIIKDSSVKIPFTKTFIKNIDTINTELSDKAFITLN